MTTKDELGDRMKDYERRETARRFFPSLPVYARIDGRGFSKFTKGMERPFDPRMTEAMIVVAEYLVDKTHAKIGYVQSDEISLVWEAPDYESDIFFSGKIVKMTSVLASMAAARMAHAIRYWEPFNDRLPAFDARVCQLPHPWEAANMFLWRNLDCQKNAASMACRAQYSPSQMHGKGRQAMIDMIAEKGVVFADYPEAFRLGTFVRKETVERPLTPTEVARIPAAMRPARLEDTSVVRSSMTRLSVPPLQRIVNRTEFIMAGADPIERDYGDAAG
ncbi:tRNA-His guanylyltransferase [Brevundimonas phage vB_BpoS-Bambus]|nr:tRNA-His guanylyltransferase [Brevundimonas phage vB_BpoS-Bambus]